MNSGGLSLYVHFPWCVKKCPYCDFNSHPLKSGELDETTYLDALLRDLDAQLADRDSAPIHTVFCGGGTPSLFSPAAFGRLLDHLAPRLAADAEITMEANPGTTEHHDFRGYRSAGINRVSFGVQSFNDVKLKSLGRIHDSAAVYQSFRLARQSGFDNVNLDLMYGLPEQTTAEAIADLEAALALEPEHLSWYQLTIEAKTEFARRPPRLPSDVRLNAMELSGYERLALAGLNRYEVSAYARPGRECRHNLQYWTFGDYLGIGAGAHGKQSGSLPQGVVRTRKAHQPRVYLQQPEATISESVPAKDLPGEFMLNVLRLVSGVDLERFESVTGLPLEALEPIREGQISAGLLEADRLAATDRGYQMLDSLVQAYF